MKLPILAAALFAATASAANALPTINHGASHEAAQSSNLIQHVDHRRWKRHHRHHDGDWRRDRRYWKYRHWNRYNHRPHGWRARGCVAFGPFWFCP